MTLTLIRQSKLSEIFSYTATYSSVCVLVCVCVCENSSDEFDIELCRIKVKVTVGVQKFSPFTTIQTVRSYSSTLVQIRNLIFSMYVHLILKYKFYECRHA